LRKSGLSPSTTYHYRVRASNIGGDSGYSNESSATTFACSYVIDPITADFGPGYNVGRVTVSAPAGCSWSATSNADWIRIFSGASGFGNGTVTYEVFTYIMLNSFRSGTITVAGRTVWIGQAGPCTFCLSEQPQPTASEQSTTDAGPRGLTARYFSNKILSGQPSLQRIDATANFNWVGKCPDAALPAGGFSVQWSSQLAAPSNEAYTFYLCSAPVELKAGEKVDIRLEYYNAGGKAAINLLWNSASTPKQILPQLYLYPEAATNKSAPADNNK
jgi:hypothetical protein